MKNREFSVDREFEEELIHTDILPHDAKHYVEAFLVSDGVCVGRNEPFGVNIVRGAIVYNSK